MRVRHPRLLLAALALAPFLPALWHPFFADDYIHIDRFREVSDLQSLLQAWVLRGEDAAAWWVDPRIAIGYFRPLVSLAFFVDWLLYRTAPFGYHLTNLALHVATTLAVYAIARRLLASNPQAFLSGTVFALHPAHAEAVLWISARTDLLVGLLVSAAFLLYLESQSVLERHGRLLLASGAVFALALLSKEMAITFPALLLLHGVIFARGESMTKRLQAPLLAAAIALLYLGLRASALGGFSSPPHPFFHGPGDADAVWNAVHGLVMYLADLVLFVPCDPVVTLPFWRGHPLAFAGLAVATVALLAGSLAAAGRSERRFSALWIGICLLPVLAVSPGERFLYLPSVGYCLLIGARGISSRRALIGVLALLGGLSFAKTMGFGSVATTSRKIVEDTLRELEATPEARFLLVAELPAVAALGFEQALRLARPGRAPEVEILSIAPRFLLPAGPAIGARSLVEDTLDLTIPQDHWSSYITMAFWGERAALEEGDRVLRDWMEVEVRAVEADRPERIAVFLSERARRRTLFVRMVEPSTGSER